MTRLLALAVWLCGESAGRQSFEPLIADWEHELKKAKNAGRIRYYAALASGAIAFAHSVARCAIMNTGWLPPALGSASGLLAFLIATDIAATLLLLGPMQAGRTISFSALWVQAFLMANLVLVVPPAMLPAIFVLRRDPNAHARHAVVWTALGAALTAGLIVLTSPEAINQRLTTFENFERDREQSIANDRAGRYQYPGTAVRQLRPEQTREQRLENFKRFETWRAEQIAKEPPLTWRQRAWGFQPAVLAVLFGIMGWLLAGLAAPSLGRAAFWWGVMCLAAFAFSGSLQTMAGFAFPFRLPHWATVPAFAVMAVALLVASAHRHSPFTGDQKVRRTEV